MTAQPGSTENVTLIIDQVTVPDQVEQGSATVSIWLTRLRPGDPLHWKADFFEVRGTESRPLGDVRISLQAGPEPGELEAAPALAHLEAWLQAWCSANHVGGPAEADWAVVPTQFYGTGVRVNMELVPGGKFSAISNQ